MLLRASDIMDMAVLLPFFRINTSLCPSFSRYYPGVLWILTVESSPHFAEVVGKQLQTIRNQRNNALSACVRHFENVLVVF